MKNGKTAKIITSLYGVNGNQIKLTSDIDGVEISSIVWRAEDSNNFFNVIVKALQN